MLALDGVAVHRVPLYDVLARYAGALDAHPAEIVVRLTADCPLADPEAVDAVVDLLIARGLDYAANTPAHRTYPKGLDVEVMRASALLRAAREAKDPYEREHVTPYLYRHPEIFAQDFISQAADEGEVRWTVDRPDDLEFVRAVYAALYPGRRASLRGRARLRAGPAGPGEARRRQEDLMAKVDLRPLEDVDSDRLYAWRNSPEVAAFMYTAHQISLEEHARWFAGIAGDARRDYRIIEVDDIPAGPANFYDIDRVQGRAAWAYYLADPSVRGKGVGGYVEFLMIERAFGEFGLRKLWCEVLASNEPVWKLHQKFGFRQEALLRAHVAKGGTPIDVMGLGLLAEDWAAVRPAMVERLVRLGYDRSTKIPLDPGSRAPDWAGAPATNCAVDPDRRALGPRSPLGGRWEVRAFLELNLTPARGARRGGSPTVMDQTQHSLRCRGGTFFPDRSRSADNACCNACRPWRRSVLNLGKIRREADIQRVRHRLTGDPALSSVLVAGIGHPRDDLVLYSLSRARPTTRQILDVPGNPPAGRKRSLYGGVVSTELGGFTQNVAHGTGTRLNKGAGASRTTTRASCITARSWASTRAVRAVELQRLCPLHEGLRGKPQRFSHISSDCQGSDGELLSKSTCQNALDQAVTIG